MLHFVMSYMRLNKSRKQTLKSVQNVEMIFNEPASHISFATKFVHMIRCTEEIEKAKSIKNA